MRLVDFINDYGIEAFEAFVDLYGDEEEAIEVIDSDGFIVFDDCHDMADVAAQIVNETYDINNMGALANYIDYEGFGRDLEIESTFIKHPVEDTYFEIIY